MVLKVLTSVLKRLYRPNTPWVELLRTGFPSAFFTQWRERVISKSNINNNLKLLNSGE
jgi:hypothetical protein